MDRLANKRSDGETDGGIIANCQLINELGKAIGTHVVFERQTGLEHFLLHQGNVSWDTTKLHINSLLEIPKADCQNANVVRKKSLTLLNLVDEEL